MPGTYGTALIRNHSMQGVLKEIENQGIPSGVVEELKNSLDCNLYFFENQVSIPAMYMVIGVAVIVLIGIYVLLNKYAKKS